ncbi:hypothetical protein I4U23_010727 [Adineta vaga]|nr:hypothetical protein I4U23_010727 [Adineta vaga]
MSSILTSDSSSKTYSQDLNEKNNFIITNPLSSSSFSTSTSRYQSTVMNKYQNLIKSDFTHPLSTLKQINHILSDQQTNMNNKYVSWNSK